MDKFIESFPVINTATGGIKDAHINRGTQGLSTQELFRVAMVWEPGATRTALLKITQEFLSQNKNQIVEDPAPFLKRLGDKKSFFKGSQAAMGEQIMKKTPKQIPRNVGNAWSVVQTPKTKFRRKKTISKRPPKPSNSETFVEMACVVGAYAETPYGFNTAGKLPPQNPQEGEIFENMLREPDDNKMGWQTANYRFRQQAREYPLRFRVNEKRELEFQKWDEKKECWGINITKDEAKKVHLQWFSIYYNGGKNSPNRR